MYTLITNELSRKALVKSLAVFIVAACRTTSLLIDYKKSSRSYFRKTRLPCSADRIRLDSPQLKVE